MTVPKMMNTADGGDTGRLPQKIEKNFLIGLREKSASPMLLQHRRRAFSQSLSLCENRPSAAGQALRLTTHGRRITR